MQLTLIRLLTFKTIALPLGSSGASIEANGFNNNIVSIRSIPLLSRYELI